jgi:hypothetical protein
LTTPLSSAASACGILNVDAGGSRVSQTVAAQDAAGDVEQQEQDPDGGAGGWDRTPPRASNTKKIGIAARLRSEADASPTRRMRGLRFAPAR